MLNRLATMTALAALVIVPALAQQPAPPSSPPAAQPAAPTMTQTFIDAQSADQWLASKLIGVSVTGTSNEKIGSVNDLLLDQDGKVLAAVIGVGGFLGIGEKNVAVDFKSTKLMRNADGDKVVLQVSKTDLEKAPAFKAYAPPRPAQPGPVTPKRPITGAPTQ